MARIFEKMVLKFLYKKKEISGFSFKKIRYLNNAHAHAKNRYTISKATVTLVSKKKFSELRRRALVR